MPYERFELTRKCKNAVKELHFKWDFPVFRAWNKPEDDKKHKRPRTWGYADGQSNNPNWFKDDGHYIATTPHNGNAAVFDYDCHPDFTKEEWENMEPEECRKYNSELIEEHSQLIPDWSSKVLYQHQSGSGRGFHVWFKRPFDPENELNGRPRFQGGDMFLGKGYIILYQPEQLLKSIKSKWNLVTPLSDADAERIRTHRKSVQAKPARKPKAGGGSFKIEKLPTAQELADRFQGKPPLQGFVPKLMEAASGFWQENLSDNPDYDWSPAFITNQMLKLPADFYRDPVCLDILGMSICHINPADNRLLDFYKACPFVDAKTAEYKWKFWIEYASSYGKPVNMGKICRLNQLLSSYTPYSMSQEKRIENELAKQKFDEFFSSRLVPDPGGRLSCDELFAALDIPFASQRKFILYFNRNWLSEFEGAKKTKLPTSKGRNKTRIAGYAGISLVRKQR